MLNTMLNILKRLIKRADKTDDDDWTLNGAQVEFMMCHHNPIEAAYRREDMGYLRLLETSEEYQAVFDIMSWDEAFDRYECILDGDTADGRG